MEKKNTRKKTSNCETCENYVYDEDFEYYVCEASLDEDEMARFLGASPLTAPITD